jgi:hypothetical protein
VSACFLAGLQSRIRCLIRFPLRILSGALGCLLTSGDTLKPYQKPYQLLQ